MSAVLKQPKGTQGGWTPVKCLEQSRKLRDQKIWLKSTGPRTANGKIKSAMNACKPGYAERRAERLQTARVRNYVRLNRLFRESYLYINKAWKGLSLADRQQEIQNFFNLKNELGKLYADITVSLNKPSNVVPFSGAPPNKFT